jgi:ABC-type transport system substrate-binding protein
MSVRFTIYFTATNGDSAFITGGQQAIDEIEAAFKKAGIRFNTQVETWDAGFYKSTKRMPGR